MQLGESCGDLVLPVVAHEEVWLIAPDLSRMLSRRIMNWPSGRFEFPPGLDQSVSAPRSGKVARHRIMPEVAAAESTGAGRQGAQFHRVFQQFLVRDLRGDFGPVPAG
jgi:hypothetical protein